MGNWNRIWMRSGKFWALLIALSATLAVAAQEEKPRAARPRLRDQGGVPLKNARPEVADPLAKGVDAQPAAKGKAAKAKGADAEAKPEAKVGLAPSRYEFKLHSFDGASLSASYYPSKLGSTAPVLILVHEANRSRKDFEDPILELQGKGLADHLQDQGYAVFSLDLRGRGQALRRAAAGNRNNNNNTDDEAMADDLQAAYQFLLDRHNRGELNVGKLGVIGMGEGANLVAAWAYQPGAAVSTEGRPSDINDMILISPLPEGSGYVLDHVLAPLALRVPMLLLAGEKDKPSNDAVEASRQGVERSRLNKIELFPSSLHGFRLLRLEPKVAATLIRHLDSTLKLRPSEWEPRYNQFPIAVTDVKTVQRRSPEAIDAEEKAGADEKAEAREKADEAAEKAKAQEKPKAEEPQPKAE